MTLIEMKAIWSIAILMLVTVKTWGAEGPYKVTVSPYAEAQTTYEVRNSSDVLELHLIFKSKDVAVDMADALNEAHNRRAHEVASGDPTLLYRAEYSNDPH